MIVGSLSDVVAKTEAELSEFWSSADTSTGTAVPKVRAATMNYVAIAVYGAFDKLRQGADALSATHAGRTFLLQVDGRMAPWDAATEVNAVCRIDGSVPICHDRVEVTFGAMAAARASSIVRSLALTEIPIVVEASPGAPALLVDELSPMADRLIVDSAETPIARIEELIRRSAGPVGDRAFVRMFSWRELVARFFDGAPSAAHYVRRVEISRTPTSRQDSAALFIGWMASRLGWVLRSRSSAEDAGGRPVVIDLVDDPRADVEGGMLTSVHLTTDLDGQMLELRCARLPGAPGIVRWTMQGARTAAYEHRLGFRDETWVLEKAIDSTEGDRVYREAVLAATEWSAL